MPDLLTPNFLTALIGAGLLSAVPLLFAGLGETIAEQAGILNVGMEGFMLVGAFTGFIATLDSGDLWLGLAVGGVAGMLISLVVALFCVRLGLDQIVVGIGVVLVVEGATSLLHTTWYGRTFPRVDAAPKLAIPVLSDIPVLGGSIFSQPLPVYVGLALVAVIGWAFRRTTLGLEIRAAGERPESLDAAGVSVVRTRTIAELTCGALAGIGGAYLAIVSAGTFVPLITNGSGFIAIVIAMIARGRPWWVVGGAVLFGMSLSVTTALQLIGVDIPIDIVQMLPFVAVIAVLVLFARNAHLPSALGLPYLRGSR
jgi:ABC-type uncharacterized transport system permease subunit